MLAGPWRPRETRSPGHLSVIDLLDYKEKPMAEKLLTALAVDCTLKRDRAASSTDSRLGEVCKS